LCHQGWRQQFVLSLQSAKGGEAVVLVTVHRDRVDVEDEQTVYRSRRNAERIAGILDPKFLYLTWVLGHGPVEAVRFLAGPATLLVPLTGFQLLVTCLEHEQTKRCVSQRGFNGVPLHDWN